MTKQFDAVILGAGPAGAATALTLAQRGRRVVLVDRPTARPFPLGESLPPAARPLLQALGVRDEFLAGPHRPSPGVRSAWGSAELQSTDYIRDPNGQGWHLDRTAFDALLRDSACDAGVTLISASFVTAIDRLEIGHWRLTGPSPQDTMLCTPWMVDGTGRPSWMARRQGVRRLRLDCLVGYAALFQPAAETRDPDRTTLVEAVPDGWWYTVVLPNEARMAVYLTDADGMTGRRARTPAGFVTLLGQTQHVAKPFEAGDYHLADGPQAVAAHSARLERSGGADWLAVGDASLSFDPLSSQGLFHALASGISAGQTIDAALGGRKDALTDYEDSTASIFQAYLGHRAAFYAMEQRWPGSAFWARRQGG